MNQDDPHASLKGKPLVSADNHLFQLARSGRLRLPESWLARWPIVIEKLFYPAAVILFAYIAPILSSLIGLPLVMLPTFFTDLQRTVWAQVLLLVGAFFPYFLLIGVWLWLFERRSLRTTGMERPFLRKYIRGLVVGLLMFSAVVVLLALFDSVAVERSLVGRLNPASIAAVLLILLGWLVQGAAEEVMTRGFLLPVLGVRWGAWAGILVSSLFFALWHLSNPNLSVISLINLALFGLFAALYALNEGGLWGVFAIHAVWNWAQGNLYGFSVSGIEIFDDTFFDLVEDGPDWLTGGLFGPEGGLVVTLILITSMLLVWFTKQKKTV